MADYNYDYPDKKDGEDLVTWLEEEFERAKRCREPYERRALQAILFLGGDQWTSVEHDMARIFGRKPVRPAGTDSARIIDNQLQIFVRQMISNISESLADFEAMPATSDAEDQKAAQLATRWIKMRDRVDKEDAIREDQAMWTLCTGEALRFTYYDPDTESYDGIPGDIQTEIVDHFHYFKAPDSGDQWPPRWLIHFDSRHVDWIKAKYGKELEPEHVADQLEALDRLAMNVITAKTSAKEEQKSSVVLKRMYAMPCEKYPKGHVFVWASKTLLDEHDLQAGFPFAQMAWYPIPGRLYPMSYIEPLISDQRQLNTLLSQIHEVKLRQLRGDIVTQGVGEVTQKIINSRTGQKLIRLDPGISKWEFMAYDLITRTAESDLGRLMNGLKDKSGLAEPSLGQVTNRDTTATELQLLRESATSKLGYHMRLFEQHICEVLKQKLRLAHDFYDVPRMIQDTGRYSQVDTDYFFGADLRDTKDIIPIPTPRMTPAMKRKAIQEAAQQGLFGPWLDPQTGLPSPFIQFSSRTILRNMGLVDEDERIAQDFGPYDDLAAKVGELQRVGEQAWLAMQQQQLMQFLAPQQPPPGQPPPEGAPPPDAMDAGMDAGGLPATPMEAGAVPVSESDLL